MGQIRSTVVTQVDTVEERPVCCVCMRTLLTLLRLKPL